MSEKKQFLKLAKSNGEMLYEARSSNELGQQVVICVTVSKLGPCNVQTGYIFINHPGSVDISEDEFMDAYFKVLWEAMKDEFITD